MTPRAPDFRVGLRRTIVSGISRMASATSLAHRRLDMADTDRALHRMLMQAPGEPRCAACLALACETSLVSMREGIEALLEDREHFQYETRCASCLRTVPAILYQQASSS
jgi:hypothetical protein